MASAHVTIVMIIIIIIFTCTNGHWVEQVIQFAVAVGASSSSTGNQLDRQLSTCG